MSQRDPLRYHMPAVVQCALGAAVADAMDMLCELEWLEVEGGGRACPWCGCEEDMGHAGQCRLGCRLAEWREG